MRLLLASAAALLVVALASGPTAAQHRATTNHLGLAPSGRAPNAQRPMPDRFPGPTSRHDVPLDSGDGTRLIVHAVLNDLVSGPMLVDTGASYCVLTTATARRLGLVREPENTVPVITASGEVDATRVRLRAVQLAEARLAAVEAVVMDAVEPPLIGILGLSFLNRFRYSIDATRGTFRLER